MDISFSPPSGVSVRCEFTNKDFLMKISEEAQVRINADSLLGYTGREMIWMIAHFRLGNLSSSAKAVKDLPDG